MWDLQNVWVEKKIFLFLPVFSLFALISSHILIGGDDILLKFTYMAKSEKSNLRRLVTLLCAILSAMEWQVSRWRLRIWSVLHANSPALTAHLLSEKTGVVSVGLFVSVSGAGNCDSK